MKTWWLVNQAIDAATDSASLLNLPSNLLTVCWGFTTLVSLSQFGLVYWGKWTIESVVKIGLMGEHGLQLLILGLIAVSHPVDNEYPIYSGAGAFCTFVFQARCVWELSQGVSAREMPLLSALASA